MERVAAGARSRLTIPVGEGIELRAVSAADCSELYAVIDRNRIRLRTWLPWASDTLSPDDLIEFVRQREIDNIAGISLTTNIWFEGAICGAIGLHTIDIRDKNTSIGYWLDAAHEGRGIMTRACRAIVTEGFRQYGLHRIEIRCAIGNDRSSAIARRLGFVEEAILREAEWLCGRWVDLRLFSMLEQDWKA
jgi:ribosomal-protein-serine acetyltransferase